MKVVVMAVSQEHAGKWPLEQLASLGTPDTSDPNRWSVGAGDHWIAVSIANDVLEEYEREDLDRLFDGMENPAIYLVEASTAKTIARYMEALPDVPGIKIDNSHGCIESLNYYKKMVRLHDNWIYLDTSSAGLLPVASISAP